MARNRVNVKDLGALIQSVGNAAMEAQKKAVTNAAFHMKNTIEGELSRDLPRGYFKNMGTKITRAGYLVDDSKAQHLRVWFDVKGSTSPTALLVARGPWGLLEYGAKPRYYIRPKGNLAERRRNLRRAAKEQGISSSRALRELALNEAFGGRSAFQGVPPLSTPFGPRYGAQIRNGAKGKKTFSRGYNKGIPEATRIATSLIQTRVIREFRTQFATTTYVTGLNDVAFNTSPMGNTSLGGRF